MRRKKRGVRPEQSLFVFYGKSGSRDTHGGEGAVEEPPFKVNTLCKRGLEACEEKKTGA